MPRLDSLRAGHRSCASCHHQPGVRDCRPHGCGGRLFFNVAGVGLDAHIAARFPVHARGLRGVLRYVAAAAAELRRYQPAGCTIAVDGAAFSVRPLMVVFANLRQYGYAAVVAPLARLDDGVLDLVVVEPAPLVADLLRACRLLGGTLHRARGVTTMRVREAWIASDAPMPFHVDGEAVPGERSLSVRVHPRALRVRA